MTLPAGLLEEASRLSDLLGWHDAPWAAVDAELSRGALATSRPIADIALITQAFVGLAAANLHRTRTGQDQRVRVDRRHASLSMTPNAYLRVDGEALLEWEPLNGFYRASDGWVYVHTGMPNLRDRFLELFDLPPDRDAVASSLAKLSSEQIENRAGTGGACVVRLRTPEEWASHGQSEWLRSQPLISLAHRGTVAPQPLVHGSQPLSGVRVLDLSRVIAGPMIGRTLAEHGAEVLRIGSPNLPVLMPLVIDTGYGKRSAHVDLDAPDGRACLRGLIRDADVLIDGYRPGALARHGLDFDDLVDLNPTLVLVTLSAFGAGGPWAGRRGFDTLVQAASGLASEMPEGPQRLPCQPLDYLTGYLGAASAMVALERRMREGGAWRIELMLARTAEWIHELSSRLVPATDPPAVNPDLASVADLIATTSSSFGQLTGLRPAVDLSETPPAWRTPPVPPGTHAPAWLS